jgi:siroheme synthase
MPGGLRQHSAAEIGLLGKNIKLNGDVVVLVNAVDTIVILMGLGNIRAIMERLQEAGCDPEMPVALIQAGTHASQRKLEVTVRSAADGAWRERFRTPNVIVVGEVVNLGKCLDWLPKPEITAATETWQFPAAEL